jgi:hypothetical protein
MSMEALFQSGNIAVIILAIMAAEVLVLAKLFKWSPALYAGLAAGACLVLALRAALLQQDWIIIAFFLALSFMFHLTELWQWRRLTKHQQR